MGRTKPQTLSKLLQGFYPIKIISLVVICQISWTLVIGEESKYPEKISLGVYKEELKSPFVFYETFVPLIYEYQVPVYKTLDITLRDWRAKCDNDNFAPSYTCPVFYHFEKFLERFEAEVVPQAWVRNSNPNTDKRNIITASVVRVDADDFCSRIQRHFKGSITPPFDFEEYVDFLRKCPIGQFSIKRALNDYVFNFKALFKKMNDNYENEFSNKFIGEVNKKIGPAFYVNAVATHQNGLLLSYWVEKTRWLTAQASCNEQRIPQMLLRPENVSTSLQDLDRKLSIGKQTTSVPLAEISQLYKLPLTDCTFIENTGNFVVTILVPVKRENSQPKIYKLQTVPFTFVQNDDVKHSQEDVKVCQMKGIEGRFLFDEANGQLQITECDPESTSDVTLCQVKERTKDPVMDLCVRSIFANSVQGVKRHCSFDCISLHNDTFGVQALPPPPIQQVASDTWVLTKISNKKSSTEDSVVSIKCEGNTEEEKLDLSESLSGALEVKLPCRCHIVFQLEVYYAQAPCQEQANADPIIRTILPVHFLKDDFLLKVKIDDSQLVLNVSSDFNEQLLMPEIKLQPAHSLEPSAIAPKSAAAMSTADISKNSNNEGGAQLGILWALVIFQLVIIVVLIAFASYKYLKFRNEVSYSKDRLVYNIYASPSDPNIEESSSGRHTSDSFNRL